MRIVIHDYSAGWVSRFATERERLIPLLPPGAIVEHIGSTSVPGLAAKELVDIMIGLANFDVQACEVVPHIINLGFVYRPNYEDVMPFRRYFFRSENGEHRSEIHMVATGTPFWTDHLLFRDHLRNNPSARMGNEALKRELATREWHEFNDYAEEKTGFILAAVAEAKAKASPHVTPLTSSRTGSTRFLSLSSIS